MARKHRSRHGRHGSEALADALLALAHVDHDTDLYGLISERLQRLVGDRAIVAVSDRDPTTGQLYPRAIAGLGGLADTLQQLLGKDPLRVQGRFSAAAMETIRRGELVHFGGELDALADGVLPAAAARAIEAALQLGEIYLVGFNVEGAEHGGFVIVTRRGSPPPEAEPVNVFARHAAALIQRQRAREELARAKQHAERYLQLAPCIILALDREGRVELLNDRGAALLEHEPAEVTSLDWFERFLPPDRRDSARRIFAALMAGELTPDTELVESEVLTRSGRVKTIRWRNTLLRDDAGAIVGTLSSGENVGEVRRIEERLRRSEAELRQILDATTDGIWKYDFREDELTLSDRYYQLLGYEPAAFTVTRQKWPGLLHAEDRARVVAATEAFLSGETPHFDDEFRLRTADGRHRWVASRARLVEHAADGTPLLAIGNLQDIHRSKIAEQELQQAQKMEALGTLAGGVAHDINNILTGIMALASLLRDENGLPASAGHDLEAVLAACERGRTLTTNLLSFARKSVHRPTLVDIGTVVESVAQLIERTMPRTITVERSAAEALPPVRGDTSQITQALMNLCLNAVDAMGEAGTLCLRASCRHAADVGRTGRREEPGVLLEVSDTGCGMSAEVARRACEPFFTTKPRGKGTGLGLATTFGLVRDLGGEIAFDSSEGVGTTVRVWLPAAEPTAVFAVDEPSFDCADEGNILLVDDDQRIRHAGARILERLGFTVFLAANGRQAVEVLQERQTEVDLVLLDLVMPEIDGWETFERMQQIAPGVPVLVMSGYSKEGKPEALLDAGARGFLQKPFDLRALARAVTHALQDDQR